MEAKGAAAQKVTARTRSMAAAEREATAVSDGDSDEPKESAAPLSCSREERRRQKAADSGAATKSQLRELERRLAAFSQWQERQWE